MTESGFVRAQSDNLPKIDVFMMSTFFASNSEFTSAELRGVKAARSERESYGDAAVGYVQVKREKDICVVRARITPEHNVRQKCYRVTATCNENEGIILSVQCEDCAAHLAIASPPHLSRSARSIEMASEVKTNAIDKLYAVKSVAACLPSEINRHKGQAGRIGIIGGSLEYTGAPYYAGISALRAGADLIHIFCESAAAIPIKCYSPELIVHPVLDSNDGLALMEPWLDRLHTVVIGPGLGRKGDTLKVVSEVIGMLKQRKIPLVIDADGLFLITENLKLLEGVESPVVLTPNAIEYQRLSNKIGSPQIRDSLGKYISILRKGEVDELLSSHEVQWKNNAGGSTRRCGGQGDLLSGSIATFLYWTLANKENLSTNTDKSAMAASVACFTACNVVRTCNEKAYKEMGMGALASDMIKYIPESLREFLAYKII